MMLDIIMLIYKGLELSIAENDESVIERMKHIFSGKVIERIKARRRLRNLLMRAYSNAFYNQEVSDQIKDVV